MAAENGVGPLDAGWNIFLASNSDSRFYFEVEGSK